MFAQKADGIEKSFPLRIISLLSEA